MVKLPLHVHVDTLGAPGPQLNGHLVERSGTHQLSHWVNAGDARELMIRDQGFLAHVTHHVYDEADDSLIAA